MGQARSPGTVLARHRPLLHRKERLARLAVEHEEHPRLRRLDDRRHVPAIAPEGHERRRRCVVVVPQIVVHRLEVPDELAGGCPERHDRVRVVVPAEPRAAVVVGARGAGRDDHEIARGVSSDHGPGVGASGAMGPVAFPALPRGIGRILRDGIPATIGARRYGRHRRAPLRWLRRCGCCPPPRTPPRSHRSPPRVATSPRARRARMAGSGARGGDPRCRDSQTRRMASPARRRARSVGRRSWPR